MTKSLLTLATSLCVISSPSSHGSDSGSKSLCILPVGQHPPTVIETIGKDKEGATLTKEKEVHARFLPPQSLYALKKHQADPAIIPLTLNRRSRPITFDKETSLKIVTKPENGALLYQYKESKSQAKNDTAYSELLLLLYPKTTKKDWSDYETRVLNNDWTHFPSKSLRVINVSSVDCALALGELKTRVNAQDVKIIEIPTASADQDYASFSVHANTKQGVLSLMNNTVMLDTPQRYTVLIFDDMFQIAKKPIQTQLLTESPHRGE
ncbi:hypothetical protein SAMN02745181_3338 [Rubritalea squalenifaciens DSM 18772]|uniref:Uncharacterized protein n=1 Tax=Rubritalea squalenifaciens DSM 18772 TaxID=1123071 RepID=A0A1M6PY05_9BACT|nr:hypothetical protein [Rubritalea squalenifaciens]SHK12810.1 hypothetical protein SAMN02745181_3338 [Rubritalea squalenifaciens DSM 18772]